MEIPLQIKQLPTGFDYLLPADRDGMTEFFDLIIHQFKAKNMAFNSNKRVIRTTSALRNIMKGALHTYDQLIAGVMLDRFEVVTLPSLVGATSLTDEWVDGKFTDSFVWPLIKHGANEYYLKINRFDHNSIVISPMLLPKIIRKKLEPDFNKQLDKRKWMLDEKYDENFFTKFPIAKQYSIVAWILNIYVGTSTFKNIWVYGGKPPKRLDSHIALWKLAANSGYDLRIPQTKENRECLLKQGFLFGYNNKLTTQQIGWLRNHGYEITKLSTDI